jgi:hypothetical protein
VKSRIYIGTLKGGGKRGEEEEIFRLISCDYLKWKN